MSHGEQFLPPPTEIEIQEVGSYPDGRVHSLTALILDSLQRPYTLRLTTAARLAASGVENLEEIAELLDAEHEPVFVVAGDQIEPLEVDDIVNGMEPALLTRYLVKQD